MRFTSETTSNGVSERHLTLDGIPGVLWSAAEATGGPVGFWGMAMGTGIGVPLVAAEPRITAAVFGLVGQDTLAVTASRITIPIEFLLQWDDELVPREATLALFDAFGSPEKTLHANSGRHMNGLCSAPRAWQHAASAPQGEPDSITVIRGQPEAVIVRQANAAQDRSGRQKRQKESSWQ